MRKTILLLMCSIFALILSCCSNKRGDENNDERLIENDSPENRLSGVFWTETESKEDIYNMINSAIRVVDQDTSYYLADDLSLLETADPVYAYCLVDDKFEVGTIYYPIIYDGHVVAMANGYVEGQFEIDVILGKAVDELDNRNIALLFADGIYAYDGDKITFLFYSLEYGKNYRNPIDFGKEYDFSNIHIANMAQTETLGYPYKM